LIDIKRGLFSRSQRQECGTDTKRKRKRQSGAKRWENGFVSSQDPLISARGETKKSLKVGDVRKEGRKDEGTERSFDGFIVELEETVCRVGKLLGLGDGGLRG